MADGEGRPAVDVVVPFLGSREALEGLARELSRIEQRPGDTVTIVDNLGAGGQPPDTPPGVRVTVAADLRSSYYARNRGAAEGHADWLLFIDADVDPPPDLLDRYFETPPGDGTGILAGAVLDEEPHPDGPQPVAARYAMLQRSMSQHNTLAGPWGYAQTANCAVRRAAFEEIGGFCAEVRSGGDADLCFRLRDAGWKLEPRDGAAVVHHSRRTLRQLVRQRARHGAGVAWLSRQYPGAFPRKRWPGLVKWTVQSESGAALALARGRRDDALLGAIEPLSVWAFELGRLLPNDARSHVAQGR